MRHAGGGRPARVALLVGTGAILGCDSAVEPRACAVPEVSRSSVTAGIGNVLSAVVAVDITAADSVVVRFGVAGGQLDHVTPSSVASDGKPRVLLLGLRDATQYDAQLVAYNDCGTTAGARLSFATDELPADLPRYSAAGADPSAGYVAFAAGNYGIVIDNSGRVVWYHRFPGGPGLNFQPQPNGRYAARPPVSAGEVGRWIEIDPLGNTTRTLGCAGGLHARLHDMIARPDGSYWLMCDEVRAVDLSASGGSQQALVLGTAIQHIGRDGELSFEWSPFDHLEVDLRLLEPADRAGAVINWTHGNSIDLDVDGNLLVSFRNLSEIVKIDTRTGAVAWRMGGAGNQFAFLNTAARPFARQHGVRATGAGRLQLLDNLGDPQASRVERYEYDEGTREARQTVSYASSAGVIALIGGTTQALPGGRTLASFGNGGSVEETDTAGNVLWRIEGNPGYVFRAHRIRSLYRPGFGDPR